MNLWCNSHGICPCISNKQIFSVTVTELEFVFYNKTVKDISKKSEKSTDFKIFFCICFLSLKLHLIKQKLIVYILLIKTCKKLN